MGQAEARPYFSRISILLNYRQECLCYILGKDFRCDVFESGQRIIIEFMLIAGKDNGKISPETLVLCLFEKSLAIFYIFFPEDA